MNIEDSSRGTHRTHQNTVILGSGLSGMVGAYIRAKALEDDAANDPSWRAEQTFRPPNQRWGSKWFASRRGGTAVVS